MIRRRVCHLLLRYLETHSLFFPDLSIPAFKSEMPLPPPIHFERWAQENAHRLQPPVNNYVVQQGDFIIMAIGGPNARTDYHVNETEVYSNWKAYDD